jgi:hypothetical protein
MPAKYADWNQSEEGEKWSFERVRSDGGSLLFGALYLAFAKRVVVHKLRLKRTPLLAHPNPHR